jgi:hypothetical protein
MDMATFTRESALNRDAYERMRSAIRHEFIGRYVAMASGKVIGSAPTFDEARALVENLDPAPEYYTVFYADEEPDFGLIYDLVGANS